MNWNYYKLWKKTLELEPKKSFLAQWRQGTSRRVRIAFYILVLLVVLATAFSIMEYTELFLIAWIAMIAAGILIAVFAKMDFLKSPTSTESKDKREVILQNIYRGFCEADISRHEQFTWIAHDAERYVESREAARRNFINKSFDVLILGIGAAILSVLFGSFLGEELPTDGILVYGALLAITVGAFLCSGGLWFLGDCFNPGTTEQVALFLYDLNELIVRWDAISACQGVCRPVREVLSEHDGKQPALSSVGLPLNSMDLLINITVEANSKKNSNGDEDIDRREML